MMYKRTGSIVRRLYQVPPDMNAPACSGILMLLKILIKRKTNSAMLSESSFILIFLVVAM